MKQATDRIRRFAILCFAVFCVLTALPLTADASGEPGMTGDITRDGCIDANDYALLKRYVLGTYALDSAQKQCADLNGDYTIDANDYILLKRCVLGSYQLPQTGNGTGTTQQGSSGSNSGGQSSEPASEAAEILRLVNRQRANSGLAALTLSDKLCELATLKAQDMVANNYFDHNSPTYGTPFEMMKRFGVSYSSAGENIAAGQRTPEEVMNAWMNSSGHRANILNASYTELGVGIAVGSKGIYWVQLFRKP